MSDDILKGFWFSLEIEYAFIIGFLFCWLFGLLREWGVRRMKHNDKKLRALELEWLADLNTPDRVTKEHAEIKATAIELLEVFDKGGEGTGPLMRKLRKQIGRNK